MLIPVSRRGAPAKLVNMKMYKLALLALACTWSACALAQWQWLDKDGRKVFSDRAPPADIPQKNILKQPGIALPVAAPDAAASATAAPAPSAVPGSQAVPKLGKDKELEEKKAQAEAAEAAKQKAEDAKIAAARADNCSRAQRAKTTLESGKPMQHTNAQGDVGFLDEAGRTAELRRIQGIIESDCKK